MILSSHIFFFICCDNLWYSDLIQMLLKNGSLQTRRFSDLGKLNIDQNVDRAAVAGSQAWTGKWIGVRYVRHFQTTHCAEAWHNWLSLDFEKVYGLPGNAMRHYRGALAMKSVTSHRFRCLGSQVRLSFHTWVGKWPTNSPVEIQLLLRWSCMKQLPYPWDWQMLIFLGWCEMP